MCEFSIIDETQFFTDEQIQELYDFVCNDLLSTPCDRTWLNRIVIVNSESISFYGRWQHKQIKNQNGQVKALRAEIVLNGFFLKTLSDLKNILAHEYGHQWTLSYLIVNRQFKINQDPIPNPYYQVRGLDSSYHRDSYSTNSEWRRCDREVIAEDYRVIFFPRTHQTTQHSMMPPLSFPNPSVRKFIQDLAQPMQSLSNSILRPSSNHPEVTELYNTHNPFIPLAGPILHPEHFFDREQELRRIFTYLAGGATVELNGHREVGKTSLLLQFRHLVERGREFAPRRVIYISLEAVRSDTEFYMTLCRELEIPNKIPDKVIDKITNVIKQRPLILLLDEGEVLIETLTIEVQRWLRSLTQNPEINLLLVIASHRRLRDLFQERYPNENVSPLLGQCQILEINRWDQVRMGEFITDRLQHTNVQFSDDEIQNIWNQTQGHPQEVMTACHVLFDQRTSNL